MDWLNYPASLPVDDPSGPTLALFQELRPAQPSYSAAVAKTITISARFAKQQLVLGTNVPVLIIVSDDADSIQVRYHVHIVEQGYVCYATTIVEIHGRQPYSRHIRRFTSG